MPRQVIPLPEAFYAGRFPISALSVLQFQSSFSDSGTTASIRRVVGLYPARLWQRRNTDYLYHHALKDLYTRMGLSFEIVNGLVYNLAATLFYQAANRFERIGWAGLRRKCANRRLRLSIPSRYLGQDVLYHGSFFGLPGNVDGNLVVETEFYDFDRPNTIIEKPLNQLKDSDLMRMRAIIVRTELSRAYYFRQYPERYHSLAKVAPFHMPYLERWETNEPVKPSLRNQLSFIFVGNQARRKGLDLFIRFATEIRRRESKRKLRFIVISNFQDGGDFDLSGLELHQGLDGDAVQNLMEQAHYLMLPTRSDSHPKVCYEAAATGCGLILSDIRPLSDIWDCRAYRFSLTDGADAMSSLAADVLAARLDPVAMGRENRRLFLREFCPSVSIRVHREALFGRNP